MNITRYVGRKTIKVAIQGLHKSPHVIGELVAMIWGLAVDDKGKSLMGELSKVSVEMRKLKVQLCVPEGTSASQLREVDAFIKLAVRRHLDGLANQASNGAPENAVQPNAIKFNGRFYKRYDVPKYNDPGAAPDYKVNHVVFETADDVLTMVNEPQDAFKYRGSYFVLSKVPIDDALDLGELVTPGSNTSDLVDRAKCFWVSPETFARYSACFSRVEPRPERDILSRPPADGGQPAIRFCGFVVIEDQSRTPASDDVLPNVLVDLIKRNEQADSLPNTPIRK